MDETANARRIVETTASASWVVDIARTAQVGLIGIEDEIDMKVTMIGVARRRQPTLDPARSVVNRVNVKLPAMIMGVGTYFVELDDKIGIELKMTPLRHNRLDNRRNVPLILPVATPHRCERNRPTRRSLEGSLQIHQMHLCPIKNQPTQRRGILSRPKR